MQFHMRLGAPRDKADRRVERNLNEAMQRIFVHLVERHIDEPREIAFDKETLAHQFTHQATDRAVLGERYQWSTAWTIGITN
jgi:hypothetical protein